ncbi:alpha/beta hydrolase [Planctomicrobium sp. SH527]|uniref:alpha/beta hydrolase n=1 Tax=Planctomicrobium sp. SH527 TaxID=3448123 RepID=UPI003F5C83D0
MGRPAASRPQVSLTPNQPDAPSGFDVARDGIERGKVTSFEYKTKSTGETYRASVYTPPGFSKEKKYPALYLLHGASGDENTWVQEIHADAILDNLYASKKLVPMVVVMPSSLSVTARGREDKSGEDSNREGRASANMAISGVLLNDLIPYVE